MSRIKDLSQELATRFPTKRVASVASSWLHINLSFGFFQAAREIAEFCCYICNYFYRENRLKSLG